ncbi:RHS repeat domain-containing protein, partial [Providencia manganoxydans]
MRLSYSQLLVIPRTNLFAALPPSGDVWRYTYDAFGRRLSKTKVVDILKINESPAFPLSKQRITA